MERIEEARVCTACGHGLRDAARFCDACGAPVTAAEPATEARKVVTVLFADLVGSTRLQETLDPESARRVIDHFAAAMVGTVTAYDGVVVKMMGDGLMASWGVPVVGEDDAVRAVRAGLAMHERLDALNERLVHERGVRLQMRVGVNTGEVVVGLDGDVVGDPVNIAARLESAAPPGGVLVGEQTSRLVRDLIALEPIEPLSLRGKGQPVPAWRATAATVGDRGSPETPFVARDAELARLRAAFDATVAAREVRLVTVIASPGMGKSRLASEFVASIADQAEVVGGRCERSGEGITFLPVAEVLRALAGVTETAEPDVTLEALQARLGRDDVDAEHIVRRAAGVLGLAEAGAPEETFWAVRRLLETAARERPLVVVLDDVHWGEPQFLDLVEHLATWTREAPVLIVALARPELRDVRDALCARGPLVLDVIELVALDAAACHALVAGVLGGDGQLAAALAERVVEATGGNPLFLGETLRMLVGDGVLRRQDGTWIADAADIDVPPTIHALLAARLERLASGERQVVERASVIGTSFPRGGVGALLAHDEESALGERLDRLRRREFVEPEGTFFIDEPVFRFHHVLIRDAAYRALLKEARAELHELFAAWLAEKAADRIGEHEEVVAYHLEQAHEYRRQLGPLDDRGETLGARAAERLGSCGRRALAREDLAAAANLLERALTRGGEDAELLVDLVEAQLSAGDTAAAEVTLERLDVIAGGDDRLRARVAVAGVELGRLTGEIGLREAEQELQTAAEVLAAVGDDAGHAKALELLARSIAPLGRIAEAETVLDRALAVGRRADDRRRVTAVLSTAPIVALYGPSPVPRASGRCLDVVRILRMGQGNRHVEARALRCQAVLEAMRDRADAARAILAGARATFEELGLRLDLLELGAFDAMVELLLGEPRAAEHGLRTTAAGLDEIGAGGALAHALLARALADQGRWDEAIVATRDAEERAGDDLQVTAWWMRVRAEALAGRGEVQEAEELARRAVALGEGTDALADHADCRLALARVLRAAGRKAEAAEEAARAAELYSAKGHEVGVGWARELGARLPRRAQDGPRSESLARQESAPAPAVSPDDCEPLTTRITRQAVGDLIARDWTSYRQRFVAGYRGRDHRRTVQEPEVDGPDGAVATMRGVLGPDTQVDVDILAGDDRVNLYRVALRGSGPGGIGQFEAEYLIVMLADGERMLRLESFDTSDEAGARARMGVLMRTPTAEVLYREYLERFRARDWDDFAALYAEDHVFTDRRLLGWGPVGRDAITEIARSIVEQYPDVGLEPDAELLDGDDRAFLVRSSWRGHAADGGGEVSWELLEVGLFREGLCVRADWFSLEQEAEARARFAELRGDTTAGGLAARAHGAIAGGDWAGYRSLLAAGAYAEGPMVRGSSVRGVDAIVAAMRSAHAPGTRVDAAVLAGDDRAVLQRVSLSGPASEGGDGPPLEYLEILLADEGRILRLEASEVGSEESARARLAELQRMTCAEGVFREFHALFGARDWESLAAMYDEEYSFSDRRLLGWEPMDRFAALAAARSVAEGFTDLLAHIEFLDADDRVALARTHWRAHTADGGGVVEYELLEVGAHREGLFLSSDWFSLEEEDEARARLAELRGSPPTEVRPTRFAETLFKKYLELFGARDWDALRALYTDDFQFTDRRLVGWEPLDRDAITLVASSVAEGYPDLHADYEILDADDDAILARSHWSGHAADGGGEVEYDLLEVGARRGDLLFSVNWFSLEQEDEARARLAELRAGPAATQAAAELYRRVRELTVARDWAGLAELWAEGAAQIDPSNPPIHGRDAVINALREVVAVSGDLSIDGEVLAAGERAGLFRVRSSGHWDDTGGSWEVDQLHVVRSAGDRIVRVEIFATDDLVAARARYEEMRTRTLVSLLMDEWMAGARARDWAALETLNAPDFVLVDHRPAGWDPIQGGDRGVEVTRSIVETFPGETAGVYEPIDGDDDVTLGRFGWHGHAADGGGFADFEVLQVLVQRDGRIARTEYFAPDDEAGARTRLAELTRPRGRVPDVATRLVDAFNRRDWEGMRALGHPDASVQDHRPLVGGRRTFEAFVDRQEELATSISPDARVEIDEFVETGSDHGVWRWTLRGTADGGAVQAPLVTAWVLRDGLLWRGAQWDAEHVEEALVWCGMARWPGALDLDNPVLATGIAVAAAVNRGDWDAARALYADDAVVADHRRVGRGALDSDGWLESARHFADLGDVRFRIREPWFVDDERGLGTTGYDGRSEDGGAIDLEYVNVSQVVAGLIIRNETFDLEDVATAWGRLVELGADRFAVELARVQHELRAVPGPVPPASLLSRATEYAACNNAAELERLRGLLHDDFIARDHRLISAPDLDADGQAARIGLLHEVMPHARLVIREWLQIEADDVLARVAFETTHGDGARTEWEWLVRAASRDGRFVSFDTYDVEDVDAARKGVEGPPHDHERTPEPATVRRFRGWVECYRVRDWDAMRALYREDFTFTDNRRLGYGKVDGDGFEQALRGAIELMPDVTMEVEDVLYAGERAFAVQLCSRGHTTDGGTIEFRHLVAGLQDSELAVWSTQWDLEDAELARAHAVVAEVVPGVRPEAPLFAAMARFLAAVAMRDWSLLETAHASAMDVVDHRSLGFADITRDEQLRRTRDMAELAPDVRLELVEALAADDRAGLMRIRWCGTYLGGGAFVVEFLAVIAATGEGIERIEIFELADVVAARTRLAEVTRPDARATELARRLADTFARRDWDRLRDAVSDDVTVVDHRRSDDEVEGREALEHALRAAVDRMPGLHVDLERVLHAGDRACAALIRSHGDAPDAEGSEEHIAIAIALDEHGIAVRIEVWEASDAHVARAWSTVAQLAPGLPPDAPRFVSAMRFLTGIATRDWDVVVTAFSPAAVVVDHRSLGWGEITVDEHLRRMRELTKLSPDVRFELLGTLAINGRAALFSTRWAGTDVHGGEFTLAMLVLVVLGENGYERMETFDVDDEAAAREAFVRLR